MMHTSSMLPLTHEQAQRLATYLQAYRRHAYACLPPSIERNNALRVVQEIQSRVGDLLAEGTTLVPLTVDEQEIRVLQAVITTLMQQLVQQPLSLDARTTALLALNDFRNLFHH